MFASTLKKHAENGSIVRQAIRRIESANLKGTELAVAISEAKKLCDQHAFDYEISFRCSHISCVNAAREDLDLAIEKLRK
ncbi:hypothetical protein [Photobacterium leiognathi]|uniref:hypothetical protein n=1 Tax=Photobacterium leiognathi TaxID=553611 RepID=UPI002981A1A5|nr:hypothetical protein [Photobacterium leiognathi]